MPRLPAIVFILCSLSACAERLSHDFSPPSRTSDRDLVKGCLLDYGVCADRDILTSGSDGSCLSVFFSCLFESAEVGRHQGKRGSWNKRAGKTEKSVLPGKVNARKTLIPVTSFPQEENLDVVREEEVHELFQVRPAVYDVGLRGSGKTRNIIDEMSQSFRRNRGGNLQTNNQPIEVIETDIQTVLVRGGKERGGNIDHIMKRLVSNDAKDSKPIKRKDNNIKQLRNVDYEGVTNEPSMQPIRNEDTTSQPITEGKRGSWNKRSNGQKRQEKKDLNEEMINAEHGKLSSLEQRNDQYRAWQIEQP